MMSWPSQYDSVDSFATRENFANYEIEHLVEERGEDLGTRTRLMLAGYRIFREQHQRMHELLERLEIPHQYRDGPKCEHHWHSGWVAEAVGWLIAEQEIRPVILS